VASVELGTSATPSADRSTSRCPWLEDDAEPTADMWATADASREQIAGLYHREWAHSDATIDAPAVTGRHVVVAVLRPGGAVDQLPDNIFVPGVPIGLGDHVYQDPLQCHLAPIGRPPEHVVVASSAASPCR